MDQPAAELASRLGTDLPGAQLIGTDSPQHGSPGSRLPVDARQVSAAQKAATDSRRQGPQHQEAQQQQQQQHEGEEVQSHAAESTQESDGGEPQSSLSQRLPGWNIRDIAQTDPGSIKPGLVYRSSEVFSKEAVQQLGIRSAIDLRKSGTHARRAVKKNASLSARQARKHVQDVQAAASKLALSAGLTADEPDDFGTAVGRDTLEVLGLHVFHVEMLPPRAQLAVFLKVPAAYKLKTLGAAVTLRSPQEVMTHAVADPDILGYSTLYRIMLDLAKKQIASALAVFADAKNLPSVVHCTHGKDRTGLLIALLQLLLGVDEDRIVQDYVTSGAELKEHRECAVTKGGVPSHMALSSVIASPAETMQSTLTYLRTAYGGIEGYAQAIGLRNETIVAIRQHLLIAKAAADSQPPLPSATNTSV